MLVQFTHPAVDRWEDEQGKEHERAYKPGNIYDLSEVKGNLWKNRGCAVDAQRGAQVTEEVAAAPMKVRFTHPAGTFTPGEVYELPSDQAMAWVARGCAVRAEAEAETGKGKRKEKAAA